MKKYQPMQKYQPFCKICEDSTEVIIAVEFNNESRKFKVPCPECSVEIPYHTVQQSVIAAE